MKVQWRALLLVPFAALAACEGGENEASASKAPTPETACAERFRSAVHDDIIGPSPIVSATFQLPDDPSAPLLRELLAGEAGQTPNLHVVDGSSDKVLEEFNAAPLSENGAVLLSGDKNLYGTSLEAPTTSAAVAKGCAMERDGMRMVGLNISRATERVAD